MKWMVLAVIFAATCGGLFGAEKFEEISHKELVEAVAAGKVALLDCNIKLKYAKGHIPGAKHFNAVKNDLSKHLPSDKGALIVAYCTDPACNTYKAGADAAAALGYTNVKHYAAGIEGWVAAKEKVEKVESEGK